MMTNEENRARNSLQLCWFLTFYQRMQTKSTSDSVDFMLFYRIPLACKQQSTMRVELPPPLGHWASGGVIGQCHSVAGVAGFGMVLHVYTGYLNTPVARKSPKMYVCKLYQCFCRFISQQNKITASRSVYEYSGSPIGVAMISSTSKEHPGIIAQALSGWVCCSRAFIFCKISFMDVVKSIKYETVDENM